MKEVGAYVLSAVGVLMMAGIVAKALSSNMSYLQLRLVIINALRQSPNRAEAMCRPMKMTFAEAIHAALKGGAMARASDVKTVQEVTWATYDGSCTVVSAGWKALVGKAKLALMAAGGGAILMFSGKSVSVLIILLTIATGIGFLILFFRKQEIERTLTLARLEVLPEVQRAFIEERYVLPPLPQ
ncbi:MAG TPA: hypothetical protein VGM88_20475 [Kofleriaceae bacterium]